MDDRLKRCPLCGHDAGINSLRSKGFLRKKNKYWFVMCNVCRASTGLQNTEQQAIKAWNRRADDEAD